MKINGSAVLTGLMAPGRFDGLQNEFQFDDFGDVNRSNAAISVVRNNRFVVPE